MKYVIDRFEEDMAVLQREDGEIINVEISNLPKSAKESDCLKGGKNGYELDEKKTASTKKEIDDLVNALFK